MLKAIGGYPKDQQLLIKVDFVFKSLDVDSLEEVDNLLSYFLKSDSTVIARNDATAAIKKYTKERKLSHDAKMGADSLTDLKSIRCHKQKLLRDYWTRMETVLDEKSSRTWKVTTFI